MKKVWFLAALFLYSCIGILGLMGSAYTEVESLSKSINGKIFFLIILSVLLGISFFYFFTKVFPKGYMKQIKFVKVLLPVIFIAISFGLNRGWVKMLNTIGYQKKLVIAGTIRGKKIERSGKTNFYYLRISDDLSGREYKFQVWKSVFQEVGNEGNNFNKEFLLGSLGIIYRSKP